MTIRSVGFATGVLLLSACCPIPVSQEFVVEPDIHWTVTDASGAPIAGAEVLLVRGIDPATVPPPVYAQTLTTGPGGVASRSKQKQMETVLPLMMHGVHFYRWTFCVTAPGYEAKMDRHHGDGSKPQHFAVTLNAGSGSCVVQEDMAATAP